MTRSYTIVLEITPTAPLTHGQGNEGNEQQLLTRAIAAQGLDGWEQMEIPAVSGSAMKATLREWAVVDALERAGVEPGAVSRDALRLLQKGGRNDSGGQSVSIAEGRRLRDLFPLLAVFGSMDGGLSIKGEIQVSDVQIYCRELADAGLLPREIAPLHVTIDGQGAPEVAIPIYEGMEPIPAHLARSTVTYYRHDMIGGRLAPMIATEDRAAVEDKRGVVAEKKATKGAAKPDKSERREANESMPHSMQCIVPGTPMVCVIRLKDATDVEFAALGVAITRWILSGGHLGGGSTKGHGACKVRVAGAIATGSPSGAVAAEAGEMVTVGGPAGGLQAYVDHVAERAAAVRAYVAESTR